MNSRFPTAGGRSWVRYPFLTNALGSVLRPVVSTRLRARSEQRLDSLGAKIIVRRREPVSFPFLRVCAKRALRPSLSLPWPESAFRREEIDAISDSERKRERVGSKNILNFYFFSSHGLGTPSHFNRR